VSGTAARRRADVPTYLTIPEVAKGMRRSVESTRRWLQRAGILEHRGGRPCVVPERLRCEFPEAYNRIIRDSAEND
jgi:CTP:molybdopterin cytidylyltransferase MocA